jgi:hypothetical protein
VTKVGGAVVPGEPVLMLFPDNGLWFGFSLREDTSGLAHQRAQLHSRWKAGRTNNLRDLRMPCARSLMRRRLLRLVTLVMLLGVGMVANGVPASAQRFGHRPGGGFGPRPGGFPHPGFIGHPGFLPYPGFRPRPAFLPRPAFFPPRPYFAGGVLVAPPVAPWPYPAYPYYPSYYPYPSYPYPPYPY